MLRYISVELSFALALLTWFLLMLVFFLTEFLAFEILLTNSGRVLSVTALSENIIDARKKVYECVDKIKFDGCFFRTDIGN